MGYFRYLCLLLFSTNSYSQNLSITVSKDATFSKAIVNNSNYFAPNNNLFGNYSGFEIRVDRCIKESFGLGLKFSDFKSNYALQSYQSQSQIGNVNVGKLYFYNQRFWQFGIMLEKLIRIRKDIFDINIGFLPTLEFEPSKSLNSFESSRQFIQEFNSRASFGIQYEIPLIRSFYLGFKSELDVPLKIFYVELSDDITPLIFRNGITLSKKL